MSNYPDGAANDPNAPWNDNREFTEWERYDNLKTVCIKCDEESFVNEHNICEKCFEPEEVEDEWKYGK
jgi:hypothetical protein